MKTPTPMHPSHDSHPHGLAHDLDALLRQARGRRDALRWLGAGAAATLLGCGGGGGNAGGATAAAATGTGSSSTTVTTASTPTTSGSTGTCSTIPSETAGPYPADGTNGINALTQSGIVRSTITSSFNGATGVADGVPLTIRLQLVDVGSSCASLAGLAVYLWHCDASGRYSLYSTGVTGENYLRGVQASDAGGEVVFTSIVPGCYDGRWPHIHFEVYTGLAAATNGGNDIKTSQLALPKAMCDAVYADARYTGSAANLARTSLASDGIFSDGSALQVPAVSGSNAAGYVATLQVGVQA